MKNFYLILLFASFLLSGCDTKPPAQIDYGVIEDGVYKNAYFGLSIHVPEGWTVQSQAAQATLMEQGGKMISGDDKNLKAVLDASIEKTLSLFSFFQYEVGAPVAFNPSIISVAEKVDDMPGIKSGADYHFHAKKLLESGQLDYEFPNEIYSKDISGVSFDVMPTQITVPNGIVKQEYYATLKGEYILMFIISYATDAQLDELNNILSRATITED